MKLYEWVLSVFGLLVVILVVPTLANGEAMSLSYRGEGIHAGMPSQGAVLIYRPVPALGISYSFNYALVDRRKEIENDREYDVSQGRSLDSAVPLREAAIERKLHELQVRWYPMNGSFFFALGGMTGSYMGRYGEVGDAGRPEHSVAYQGSTTYGSFSLGNLWIRHHIVIGFEWVGIAYNLSRTEKVGSDAGTFSEEELLFRKQLRQHTEGSGITLGVFHLGLAF